MSENYRLSIREKNRYSLFLKTISLALVISFLFQELLYANPDAQAIASYFQGPVLSAKPPSSIASLQDSYKSANGKKSVILIQDAHVNESAQKNIAKILDLVFQKEPLKYVFLEAGTGNDSLSFLRKYADRKKRL